MSASPLSTSTDSVNAKVRKFPCESCGADVRWDPGAESLKCPYCGAVKQIVAKEGVAEKPVEGALRAPRDLGWGAERKVIACKRCGAHTTLDPHVASASCAFCGTSAVVEAPPNPNVVRPEGILPFRVTRDTAITSFRKWQHGLWFRPNDLKASSRVTAVQGAYIPFWTFDAATHSEWTAEAGYYYYVDVEYTENGQTRRRQERRVRWEPAAGELDHFFDDVPVPASKGVEPELYQDIEPYPTGELVVYEPSFIAGFLAEENAVDLPDALESAKERMRTKLHSLCSDEVPGDTQRNLEVSTTFSALAYKNALLPIWIAAYDYHGTPYRFLVNGVTGKTAGTAPWSWVKITFAILVTVTLLLLILYFINFT